MALASFIEDDGHVPRLHHRRRARRRTVDPELTEHEAEPHARLYARADPGRRLGAPQGEPLRPHQGHRGARKGDSPPGHRDDPESQVRHAETRASCEERTRGASSPFAPAQEISRRSRQRTKARLPPGGASVADRAEVAVREALVDPGSPSAEPFRTLRLALQLRSQVEGSKGHRGDERGASYRQVDDGRELRKLGRFRGRSRAARRCGHHAAPSSTRSLASHGLPGSSSTSPAVPRSNDSYSASRFSSTF